VSRNARRLAAFAIRTLRMALFGVNQIESRQCIQTNLPLVGAIIMIDLIVISLEDEQAAEPVVAEISGSQLAGEVTQTQQRKPGPPGMNR